MRVLRHHAGLVPQWKSPPRTRGRIIVLALALISGVAWTAASHAEIFSNDWTLCYGQPSSDCGTFQMLKLDGAIHGGTLGISISSTDYDDSSVTFDIKLTNNSDYCLEVDGSFLRNGRAVATLDWGNLSLRPRQSTKGRRTVGQLGRMGVADSLSVSVLASATGCG